MNSITTLGEIRPTHTTGDPHAEAYIVPLLALRRREWRVIPPDQCRLGPSCLVCQWRQDGLLDLPAVVGTTVVGEPAAAYGTCPSSYCPACNTLRCVCPPAGYEDDLAEQAYQLGHEHGLADGPDNRPTRRWCADAGLDAESYLSGYDDACAGLPVGMPAEALPERPTMPVLWDDIDDLLPF